MVVGDLNVAHEAVDLAKPRSNANKTPGFCDGERDNFSLLLHDDGFVDTWRAANETVQCFSYWVRLQPSRAHALRGWPHLTSSLACGASHAAVVSLPVQEQEHRLAA